MPSDVKIVTKSLVPSKRIEQRIVSLGAINVFAKNSLKKWQYNWSMKKQTQLQFSSLNLRNIFFVKWNHRLSLWFHIWYIPITSRSKYWAYSKMFLIFMRAYAQWKTCSRTMDFLSAQWNHVLREMDFQEIVCCFKG